MQQAPDGTRIGVILAGGGGRRMGGADKGALMLAGKSLAARVVQRLSPQVDHLLISGAHDYGSGLLVLADRKDGPVGPAAGLWSALRWIEEHAPKAEGFVTAPVDGPFTPADLFERLSGGDGSAIASDGENLHPTFGYWRCDALRAAIESAPAGYGFPLKELAEKVSASHILFGEANAFLNVNTPEDLATAEKILRD